MKKILTVLLLLFFIGSMESAFPAGAAGKLEHRTINVGSFNRINVSSIINVTFIQGKATGEVQVSAPSSKMKYVKVEVNNKELSLSYSSHDNSRNNDGPINVTVQAPSIVEVTTTGASSFKVKGELNMKEKICIESSGASNINIPVLRTTRISLSASGASAVKMQRMESSTLKIYGSGASNIKITDALSPKIYLESSGTAYLGISNYSGEKLLVSTSGVSKTEVKTTDADILDLESTGVSSLKVGNIDAKMTDVTVSGEAVAYLWGKSQGWNKNVSGGGKIKTNVGTSIASQSSSVSSSKSTSKSTSKSSSRSKSSRESSKKSVPTQAP